MKQYITNLYQKYPLLFIVGVFLIIWGLTVYLMKKATLKKKVENYTGSRPDIMNLSYLGRTDLPRGIRNNNPGNLVKTSIPWQGKVSPSTDSRFEQFEGFVWGLRAKIRDIVGDIKNKNQNTIRKLITAFAPPFENNTANYIQRVSAYTGIGADTLLTGSKEEIRKLSKIICVVENGNPQPKIGRTEWYDDATFDVAWDLAY
jgi:hypothetical protein